MKRGNAEAHFKEVGLDVASTGPHFMKRGNRWRNWLCELAYPGFNGAALHEARKWSQFTTSFCRPLTFNGAALHEARKCRSAFQGSRLGRGFNGAALHEARKSLAKLAVRAGLSWLQRGRTS